MQGAESQENIKVGKEGKTSSSETHLKLQKQNAID